MKTTKTKTKRRNYARESLVRSIREAKDFEWRVLLLIEYYNRKVTAWLEKRINRIFLKIYTTAKEN